MTVYDCQRKVKWLYIYQPLLFIYSAGLSLSYFQNFVNILSCVWISWNACLSVRGLMFVCRSSDNVEYIQTERLYSIVCPYARWLFIIVIWMILTRSLSVNDYLLLATYHLLLIITTYHLLFTAYHLQLTNYCEYG